MWQKLLTLTVLVFSISSFCHAQNKKTAILKGKLVNSSSKTAFHDLKISIPELSAFTTSDEEGYFTISEVPYGKQTIIISSNNAKSDTISVNVDMETVDLHDISITPNNNSTAIDNNDIPIITVSDNSATSTEDDGVSSGGEGIAITQSRDPFLSLISGIWNVYNFRYRGYQNYSIEWQVNGISLNDLETNTTTWNQTGRLYDVFGNREGTYGLAPSDYAIGGLNGTTNVDASAINQREGTSVTYTFTDHNYSNGVMLTKNSGLMANGWAYSASFAKRYAEQGYVPGTSYNDYSYFAAVSKVIKNGNINLTTFGSPIDHGKGGSATQEAYNLAGTNYYNQYWGYLNGQKLDSKVEKLYRPITVLNYVYNPSDKIRWNTSAGYEAGKDNISGIDYYNAPSPYGDYYKNMPSYYLTMVPPDSLTAAQVRKQIQSNPQSLQIDWNRMYQDNYANTQTVYNVNGVAGNNYTGKESEYVLGNTVKDLKKMTFNTNLEYTLNENITLYGGLTYIHQTTENYDEIASLLGGDFFVNYNQFPSQQLIGNPTYNQNNLNDPNAIVKTGDKYDFDYTIRMNNALGWGQAVYTDNKFEFFTALNAGNSSFNRDGFMRNGLFPNNSYGSSPTQSFFTYSAKGGAKLKLDPHNTFFINGYYSTTPPTSDNTYISAETRDFTVTNPTVQRNQSMEAGYTIRYTRFSARAVGYVTDMKNVTEIKRFYNDDPTYNTYVNYVMQGENTRSIGTELSANYQLSSKISVSGAASIGQAYYTNRPTINVYLDNDTTQHSTPGKAYIQNYYLPVGAQTTYLARIDYHPRKDMFINLSFNYFDRNYVEIDPNRRTTAAAGLYLVGSPTWNEIFAQEKLPSAFTVDLRAGKTFQLSRSSKLFDKLSHNTILVLSASIDNLLNNTDVINFGYEQLRYDFTNNNPDKFANKYIYAMGINFLLSATLKF